MGLTDNGFERDTLEELNQEAKDNFIATFEDPINNKIPSVLPDSFFGLLSGIIAKMREQIQESIEEVYFAFFISTATGVSLDRAVEPTERDAEKKAEVTLKFFGTPGQEILGGTIAETAEKVQFLTDSTVNIGGGGDVEINAIADIAGTAGNVSDDTIIFLPVPIGGVDSVTNELQSVGGEGVESDPDLRQKAIDERNAGRTSSLQAIVNRVKAVENVSTAVGAENTGTVVDGDGRPPGSVEITARGGDDTDIANAILNSKAAGVETFGTESVVVVDSSGNNVTINFSRATLIEIFVKVDLTTNVAYDNAQDDVIRQLILDYIGGINPDLEESRGLDIGDDVFAWKVQGTLFDTNNPNPLIGIDSVVVKVGLSAGSQTLETIAITSSEEAITDFDKIFVNEV